MSTENGKYVADDNGRLDKRKAVKGFAEFCCSPVQNKDTWQESAEDYKVRNTKLEYTYPVRNSNTNLFLLYLWMVRDKEKLITANKNFTKANSAKTTT